jgi:hypothetical protein
MAWRTPGSSTRPRISWRIEHVGSSTAGGEPPPPLAADVVGVVSLLEADGAAGAAVVGVVVPGPPAAAATSVVEVTGTEVDSGTIDVEDAVAAGGEVVDVGRDVIGPAASAPNGTVVPAWALVRTGSFDA